MEDCEMVSGKSRLRRWAFPPHRLNRGASSLVTKEIRKPSSGIRFALTYSVELTIVEEITMQSEILERTIEVRDQLGAEVKRVKEAVTDASDFHSFARPKTFFRCRNI